MQLLSLLTKSVSADDFINGFIVKRFHFLALR